MYQNPELNLTTEVYELLFTDIDCSPIKSPFVLRRFNRDAKHNIIKCKYCTTNGFKEASLMCPYCKGEGSIFKDSIIEGYIYKTGLLKEKSNFDMLSKAGMGTKDTSILITDSTTPLYAKDKVFKLELDENARIKVPVNYLHTFNIYYVNKLKASTNSLDYSAAVLWD